MTLLVLLFVLSVIIPIAVGMIVHHKHWSFTGNPIAWGQAAAARFGSIQAAIGIAIVGWACTFAISLSLGFVAKALESPLDEPVFRWIHPRVHDGKFTRLNEKLTYMGNNPIIQIVALVAVVILVFAYKRRWWIPLFGIAAAYFSEHYLQKYLAKVVDRGHPPTTLGTFPSGGVGRILAVYSVILLLVIFLLPALSRAWRIGLWTGLVTAATIECFTRIYLSRHWLTDALAGLPFGLLLALTGVSVVSALAAPAQQTSSPDSQHRTRGSLADHQVA